MHIISKTQKIQFNVSESYPYVQPKNSFLVRTNEIRRSKYRISSFDNILLNIVLVLIIFLNYHVQKETKIGECTVHRSNPHSVPTKEALDSRIGNKDGDITMGSGNSMMLEHTQNFHNPCNSGGGHHRKFTTHNISRKISIHQ